MSQDDGVRASEVDPTRFHGSERRTIGVELELPVLDRDSHELVPGAPRILEACRQADVPGLSAELMQSMLEVKTGVCESSDDVAREILDRLRRARNIARSLGYELGMLGAHPFDPVAVNALSPDERYGRVAERLGWLAWHRVTLGLHVHVGVRSGDEAIWVIHHMVPFLPHLLGASANSPFWQGVDTGFASFRMALYGLVPHAGIPRSFGSWSEFRAYFQSMQDCGILRSMRGVKWDVRPRPDLGTIEVRICDTPPSLGRAFGLAALVRCLVESLARLVAEHPESRRPDPQRDWIDVENKWVAARRGLDAVYLRTSAGKRRSLRQELEDLVARMRPIAVELGDERQLLRLVPVGRMESGAERQRRLLRETGDWLEVTRDAIARLDRDLAPPVPATPARREAR
jgi:carboxylate-amine ligase